MNNKAYVTYIDKKKYFTKLFLSLSLFFPSNSEYCASVRYIQK